eukprot:459168_1
MHLMIPYYQKNKHLNQRIRFKFQDKRDVGVYYKNKKDKMKIKKRNKTKNNNHMIQYVPSAPYPSVDHWEHPMSYHNLKLLDKDLQMREAKQHTNRNIKNVKTINKTKHKYK